MIVRINKPVLEDDFVNLYHTVAYKLIEADPELPDYSLEPNIMDDGEIEEIVDLFNSYYKELRNMQAKLISDEKNYWEIEIS